MIFAITSIAIGFGLVSFLGEIAHPILIGIVLFWLSNVIFLVSDWIDAKPYEKRGWISYVLNIAGLLIAMASGCSFLLGFLWILVLVIGVD